MPAKASSKPIFTGRCRGVHVAVFPHVRRGSKGEFTKLSVLVEKVYRDADTDEFKSTNNFDLDDALILHRQLGQAIDFAMQQDELTRKERFNNDD